jgi:hypothetical protein
MGQGEFSALAAKLIDTESDETVRAEWRLG